MSNALLQSAEVETSSDSFVDRRQESAGGLPARERRQFSNSYSNLSNDAAELANAIDSYKASNRRRFINYEEMLEVVKSLGYSKI